MKNAGMGVKAGAPAKGMGNGIIRTEGHRLEQPRGEGEEKRKKGKKNESFELKALSRRSHEVWTQGWL